jgi:hypothetical protein
MADWSILKQFLAQPVQSVNLLVIAATEGSYTAQAFVFDTQSGEILSTLLIVDKKLDSPSDPNLPAAVSYVTINSNALIKQQNTPYEAIINVENVYRQGDIVATVKQDILHVIILQKNCP